MYDPITCKRCDYKQDLWKDYRSSPVIQQLLKEFEAAGGFDTRSPGRENGTNGNRD